VNDTPILPSCPSQKHGCLPSLLPFSASLHLSDQEAGQCRNCSSTLHFHCPWFGHTLHLPLWDHARLPTLVFSSLKVIFVKTNPFVTFHCSKSFLALH
jgi:hypothetical protein